MRALTPHFLLFSETRPRSNDAEAPCVGGRWRFVLESVDGSMQFSATDDERECAAERLDLLAVVRGLEALDQPSRVTLVTRSRYVRRGIRFGLQDWCANNWTWESYGEMTPVPNADLWRRVDRALGIHEVCCRNWTTEPLVNGQASVAATRSPTPPAQLEREPQLAARTQPASIPDLPRWSFLRLNGQQPPNRLLTRFWRRWQWASASGPLVPNGV